MTWAFTAALAPEAAAVPTFSGGACPVLPSPGTGTGIPRDARNGEKGKKNEQRRMKRWRMHSVASSSRNISTRTGEKPVQGGFGFPFPAGLRLPSCSWEHGQVSTRASLSTCRLTPLQRLPLARSIRHQSRRKTNEIPGYSFLATCPLLLFGGKGTCPCQGLAVPAPKKTSLFCP